MVAQLIDRLPIRPKWLTGSNQSNDSVGFPPRNPKDSNSVKPPSLQNQIRRDLPLSVAAAEKNNEKITFTSRQNPREEF